MRKLFFLIIFFLLPFICRAAYEDLSIEFHDDFLFEHGKTFAVDDERFRLGIFPKAMEYPVRIELRKVEPSYEMMSNIPNNKKMISSVYLYDVLRLNDPFVTDNFGFKQAAITLAFEDYEYKGKSIYYWDNITKKWTALPSNKSRHKNWMTAWIALPYARVAIFSDLENPTYGANIDFSEIFQAEVPLESESYLIVNETDRKIVGAHNIFDKYPIASLTKLMTASVLVENNIDMDASLQYIPSKHYAFRNYLGLQKYERVKVRDLFNAMLIGSLNVPARMLVDATDYTEKEFVARMNQKSKELGMFDTWFDDNSGLSVRNASTVFDLYILFKSIQNNEIITESLGRNFYEFIEVYSTNSTELHKFRNTNYLMSNNDEEVMNKLELNAKSYDLAEGRDYFIIQSKTGYTEEALYCLAMLFQKDGKEYTLISLGNENYQDRFAEAVNIVKFVGNTYVASR